MLASTFDGHGLFFAIIGAVLGIGMLWYTRRTELGQARDEARDEAMQLAAVRKDVIDTQNARISALESEVAALKLSIEKVRADAIEAQQTLAGSVRLSLRSVRGYLEQDPPNVASALSDLRDMLDGDAPKPNGRR